jgi:hemolysin III
MSDNNERPQSLGEDIANSISHGFGVVSIAAAAPFLILASIDQGSAWAIVCASIFTATAVLLYLASTLYHALPAGRAKRVLQLCDHNAIFLLIAGTYTPFTLGALRGPWGWSLFGVVWGLAVLGITVEVLRIRHREFVALTLYVTMGWLALIAIYPLVQRIPAGGLLLLLAGGLAYTVGIVFYVYERVPYAHLVWHLFVLAGTTFHFFAVLNYAN